MHNRDKIQSIYFHHRHYMNKYKVESYDTMLVRVSVQGSVARISPFKRL